MQLAAQQVQLRLSATPSGLRAMYSRNTMGEGTSGPWGLIPETMTLDVACDIPC